MIISRTHHIDIAQHAAQSGRKWIDNLLSHHSVPGVTGGTQGSARRIDIHGIYHIALIHRLTREAGLRTTIAVSIATRLLDAGGQEVCLVTGVELRLDRAAFERGVDRLIAEAVEAIQPSRRGRPPNRAVVD